MAAAPPMAPTADLLDMAEGECYEEDDVGEWLNVIGRDVRALRTLPLPSHTDYVSSFTIRSRSHSRSFPATFSVPSVCSTQSFVYDFTQHVVCGSLHTH